MDSSTNWNVQTVSIDSSTSWDGQTTAMDSSTNWDLYTATMGSNTNRQLRWTAAPARDVQTAAMDSSTSQGHTDSCVRQQHQVERTDRCDGHQQQLGRADSCDRQQHQVERTDWCITFKQVQTQYLDNSKKATEQGSGNGRGGNIAWRVCTYKNMTTNE